MRNYFTSKQDGMSRAKPEHMCVDCRHHQTANYKACPKCGSKNRVYFRSNAELKRAFTLLFLQDQGRISNIEFLPKYQLVVNDVYICTYEADAAYMQDGKKVVEDTKGKSNNAKGYFQDKTSVFKIKLFEAIWGIKVHIAT